MRIELLVLSTIFSFIRLDGWIVPCQARPIGADTRDSVRHARRARHSRLAAKALVGSRTKGEHPTSSHTLAIAVSNSNGSAPVTPSQLAKRSSNGKATFYAVRTDVDQRGSARESISDLLPVLIQVGQGACGGPVDYEPAYVVAMNHAQFGSGYPGPECGKSVTIQGGPLNGHAQALITDLKVSLERMKLKERH